MAETRPCLVVVQVGAKADAEVEEMRGVLATRGSQFDALEAQVAQLKQDLKEAQHVSRETGRGQVVDFLGLARV